MAKILARGRKISIIRQLFKDQLVTAISARLLGSKMKKEIAHLCSDASILVKSDISGFTWEKIMYEMKGKAPLLLALLKQCTRTRKKRLTSQSSIIGIVVAIMCKYNRACANLVQKMLSVILYGGQSRKIVSYLNCMVSVYNTVNFTYIISCYDINKVVSWL